MLRQNVQEFCHRFRQMFKISQVLDDRCLGTYIDGQSRPRLPEQAVEPTERVTVMFYRDAQYLEGVHPDGHAFDSLLALQYQIDRSREETDESVAVGSS